MYGIDIPDTTIKPALIEKINNKTKPIGALGQLEALALQIGIVQNTLSPKLSRPVIMVFAGDHGIVEAGVSQYPQDVTQQMVMNFLAGGAGINVFAELNGMAVRVVDSGVNHDFSDDLAIAGQLIDAKIAMGTRNFLLEPAMTLSECRQALNRGAELAQAEIAAGSNVIGFGEMGIGNTSSASALMAVLCGLPVQECVGRGTGLDAKGLKNKSVVLSQAIEHHKVDSTDHVQVLATFGGFEIAMMTGAMLGAATQKAILLIDGFIGTASLLVAAKMQPAILDYCIFSHCSDEAGHKLLLESLNVKPLLSLDLRLGEGTGAALAYPLLKAAAGFLNDMASFESAKVSRELNSAP